MYVLTCARICANKGTSLNTPRTRWQRGRGVDKTIQAQSMLEILSPPHAASGPSISTAFVASCTPGPLITPRLTPDRSFVTYTVQKNVSIVQYRGFSQFSSPILADLFSSRELRFSFTI